MTTYYFDSDLGSDANAGTSSTAPKRNYDAWNQGSTAAGDRLLFKRGTTQVIATAGKSLIGGTAAAPVYYGAYGDASLARPRFTFPVSPATGIFNQSRRSHYVVEDWHFDMQGAAFNSMYISAMSLGPVTNVRIRRCLFENAGGDYPGLYIGRENHANQTTDVVVEDCVFRNNGADGITVLACNNVRVRRCVGYDNGSEGPNGGHNFRFTSRKVTVSSGWTLVSGTIYSRPLASYETTIYFVQTPTYARMAQNTATPTAPTAGQYGVSGGLLYVNNNANPAGVSTTYVWDPCNDVAFEDCESFRSLWNPAAPFHEGHGFSADDFASNCRFIACHSHDNEGLGFSLNGGDNNLISGCLVHDNEMRAVSLGSGVGNRVINSTCYRNNIGRDATTAELAGSPTAINSVVSNNIIIGNSNTYGVYFDAASGCVASNNAIYGVADAVFGGTESNTITYDPTPYLDSAMRLKAMPLPGNLLANAGAYVHGIRLMGGRRPNPRRIPVGAFPEVRFG